MMRLLVIQTGMVAYVGVVWLLGRMAGSKWHPDGGTLDGGIGDQAAGAVTSPLTLSHELGLIDVGSAVDPRAASSVDERDLALAAK